MVIEGAGLTEPYSILRGWLAPAGQFLGLVWSLASGSFCPPRSLQLLPILLRLIRIQRPELRQRLRKSATRTQVSRYHQRIARARMPASQQLAADLRVSLKPAATQVLKLD